MHLEFVDRNGFGFIEKFSMYKINLYPNASHPDKSSMV